MRRLSRNSMRQIAVRTDRTPVMNGPMGLSSLPRTLSVTQKTDTIDTHENQFIKYVLTTFYAFCSSLSTKKNATAQLKTEVEVVCEILAGYLNNSFFKQISRFKELVLKTSDSERNQGFESLPLRHKENLFCLPRQERFFLAFRGKIQQKQVKLAQNRGWNG